MVFPVLEEPVERDCEGVVLAVLEVLPVGVLRSGRMELIVAMVVRYSIGFALYSNGFWEIEVRRLC